MSWRLLTAVAGVIATLLLHGTVSLLPHLHGAELPSEPGMEARGDDPTSASRLAAPDTAHGGRCLACALHTPAAATVAGSPGLPTPPDLDVHTEARPQPAQRQAVRSLRSRGPPARV